ncbi:MAG: aldo/keto reductase [Sinobacteraceae bacterium]|nr:aldo/keto reductase [Nevskiaceae bacterium]MCP5466096.1 aldo/keto reductase [Nevskiaceae bacterium]MCP5471498.1 aldo/keto reductase [Nevskiaceae bacterium]
MRFRQLGRSGLKVSELCLGTMTFGEQSGFGAAAAECRRMFDAYLEAGGNFIDTANIYTSGTSEQLLAEMIAAERGRLVVASKFSMTTDPRNPNAGGNSRKNLQQSLEASLRRLGTDYLDLYWVHAWDGMTPLDELLRALDDAVRAGKVLYTGFSNVPAWVVARAQTLAELRGWSRFVALQLHYSLVERGVERELLPCATALGLAVTAWSPLGGGVLSGKYSSDPAQRAAQPGRLTTTGWGRLLLNDRNLAIASVVREVAEATAHTPSQVALRWLLHCPGGVVPIIGTRSLAQLQDLLGATRFELDTETLAQLDAASAIDPGYPKSLLDSAAGRRMVHGEMDAVRAGVSFVG